MAKRRGKAAAGLMLMQQPVLEPVSEDHPNDCHIVRHRTVDTLGLMLRAGTITLAACRSSVAGLDHAA